MRHRGNTMTEYGLIGATVLVVTGILLLAIGQGTDSLLKGLKGDMKGSIASADGFQKKALNEKFKNSTGGSFTGATLSVCTGKFCVEIPYSKQNQAVVQTSGGMGNEYTTSQFIQLLNMVVPTLRQDEVENLLGKLLTDLSNTTIEVADSQYNLSQICQGVGQCDYNFNIPDSVFNALTGHEKGKIKNKIQAINELKVMIDQLKGKGLSNQQQVVVDATVDETNTTAINMNLDNATTASIITNFDGTQQSVVADAVFSGSTAAPMGSTAAVPATVAPSGIVQSQMQNHQAALQNAALSGDPTAIAEVNANQNAVSANNNQNAASIGAQPYP